MNKMQALQNFWSSYNLTAYDESAVPDTAEMPYITYQGVYDEVNYPVVGSVSLWYHGTSLLDVSEKVVEISDDIGRGGKLVSYDDGALWIKKGSPFAQRMTDEDDMVRRMVLQIQYEYLD